MKRLISRLGFDTTERGSALLVTLMLIVGVSLLGLGFVAVSETENAISLNQRNSAQVLAVGESGLRVAIEWFQDPTNANAVGVLPPNLTVFKTKRSLPTFSTPNYYKDGGGYLFDKPFRPNTGDRLYGTEKSADVIINESTAEGKKFIDAFNAKIFGTEESTESCTADDGRAVRCARITDIRVYAPPIVGGTLVDDGTGNQFWDGGIRYGYASIRVMAEKRNGSEVIARRTVRSVISEWPFPGPQGPVQSNANIATGGNLQVHWGKMTAMGDLGLPAGSKIPNCLPWYDANERMHFERGWDSSHPYTNGFNYAAAGLNFKKVHSTNTTNGEVAYTCTPCSVSRTFGEPPFTGTYAEVIDDHPGATVWAPSTAYTQGQFVTTAAAPGITYEAQANGTSGAAAPAWSAAVASLTTETTGLQWKALGAMTWTANSYATEYPLGASATYDDKDWFYEVVSDLNTKSPREIQDIWWEVRSRSDINDPAIGPSALDPLHLIKYKNPAWEEFPTTVTLATSDAGGRGAWAMFQGQDTTVNPGEKKEVTFPRIDYDFWKEIAIQGNGTNRVYYLRWVGSPRDDSYSNGIQTKKFIDWCNTDPGLAHPNEAGFYFFDTKNGVNPQITGGATSPYLTPELTLNNSDANPMQMKGFIYVNTVKINFNGVTGINDKYAMPGEPYRDIGVREVDPATGKYKWDTTTKAFSRIGQNDGRFSAPYDLNSNGIFGDIGLEEKTITRVDDGTTQTYKVYFPMPYTPECFAAGNLANNALGWPTGYVGKCSEPQEPYLNLRYKAPTWTYSASETTPALEVSWGSSTLSLDAESRPKKKKPSGALPTCPADGPEFCTTLRYDQDGAFITLDPIMIGILYNEGAYTATGNPRFFGSILINGDVDKAGTGQVYFDESLLKGTWQDQFDFPRVFESSHETDK